MFYSDRSVLAFMSSCCEMLCNFDRNYLCTLFMALTPSKGSITLRTEETDGIACQNAVITSHIRQPHLNRVILMCPCWAERLYKGNFLLWRHYSYLKTPPWLRQCKIAHKPEQVPSLIKKTSQGTRAQKRQKSLIGTWNHKLVCIADLRMFCSVSGIVKEFGLSE